MLNRGMQEHEHRAPSVGQFVGVLLLTVLMVLGVNAFAKYYLADNSTNYGYRYVSHKWKLLQELEEPVDWLVLGDSSVAQGFDPNVLAQETGESALNLGSIGAYGLVDDEWMLEEYIRRFGPPKKVVVVHVYDVWRRGFAPRLLGRIPLKRAMSKATDKEFGLNDETRIDRWTVRHVPLYAEKGSIHVALELAWYQATKTDEEMAELRLNDWRFPLEEPTFTDSGYIELCGAIPKSANRDYRQHRYNLTKHPEAHVSRTNRRSLRRMGKLAEELGFDLYVLNGPIHRKLPRTTAFKNYWGQLEQQIASYTDPLPWVHFSNGFFRAQPELLTSVDHLSCEAAPRYTRWVIRQVKRLERAEGLGVDFPPDPKKKGKKKKKKKRKKKAKKTKPT